MKSVWIKKQDLLAKVKENRELHSKLYLEAVDGFKKAVVEKLELYLEDTKKGKYHSSYHLEEPINQLADYDRVIAMLEMSINEDIELSDQEFDQYVLDNWHWKSMVSLRNSTYSALR